jgi:Ni2+-binding GTPase involved in maturation of urease and hydrogenase
MAIRFIMLGGFLGAGKTTTLARLAKLYQARGLKVGVVTNDQAQDLVDTNLFRAQGFAVEEVPGACFCCRFDELVGRVAALEAANRPDVILAEPVGSCTDLVATVVQPLKDLYGTQFQIAPYAVLFKPSHGVRILKNQPAGGFSPKAAYIFKKQLEEADAIVINRIDELTRDQQEDLAKLVATACPGVPALRISAATGDGFDSLIELLEQTGGFGRKILDIDYDTYAEGEAELGWLNASARLTAAKPFDLDALLMAILNGLAAVCQKLGGEVAHLKLIGMDDGGAFGVGNVVSSDTTPKLSLASGVKPQEADLIVNARVAVDPAVLEAEVKRVVAAEAAKVGAVPEFRTSQSLRPGRPTPTHRYAAAKA